MSETGELRREDFEAWLKGQPPRRVVGRKVDLCDCPAARWLRQKTGRRVDVTETRIQFDGEGRLRTPYWLRRFILRVDKSHPAPTVRASAALRILREIPSDE